METATRRGSREPRDIETIPELQRHLRRNRIDFKTFEARQALGAGMQMDADALNLARRKLNLKRAR